MIQKSNFFEPGRVRDIAASLKYTTFEELTCFRSLRICRTRPRAVVVEPKHQPPSNLLWTSGGRKFTARPDV